jgi:hypothetical protein
MLAEIFVLRLEAERRALETAVDTQAPRFVPFKSEPWQGATIVALRRIVGRPVAQSPA